ncbi:MAG: PilN domain-containing protein [Verrucomicrobiales bacterium]|nr:PilN domain-containing protein [Verrucomicrobiales bacterium]
MSRPAWMTSNPVLIECGQDSMRVHHRGAVREWRLERSSHGRLGEATRELVAKELPAWIGRAAWQPRLHAWCAVSARGVTVRRFSLPSGGGADLEALVAMQVEAEFPLPAEQLAWGFARVSGGAGAVAQEVVVAAVKREVIDDYRVLLEACGLQPRFTLSAWVRGQSGEISGAGCLLVVEGRASEWAAFDAHGLESVRVVPWGLERLAADYAGRAVVSMDEAAGRVREWWQTGKADSVLDAVLAQALGEVARERADLPATVMVEGATGEVLVEGLRRTCPRAGGWRVAPTISAGGTALLRGLERWAHHGDSEAVLELRVPVVEAHPALARGIPRRWAVLAAILLGLALAAPHVEVALLQPGLARRVAALKAEEPRLAQIEEQWEFMRNLKQSQPPYLDALVVISKSIPQGTQLESVSMNGRGDLVLRGALRTSQDVVGFRSKLVESGFFTTVVVDEQTPTPDRQQVNYRITAHWKEASLREGLPILKLDDPGATSAPGEAPKPRGS